MNVLAAAFALVALVLSSTPGAHAAAEKLRIATTGGYPTFQLHRRRRTLPGLRHRHRPCAVREDGGRVRVRPAGLEGADPGAARRRVGRHRRQHVHHRQAAGAGVLHGEVLQQRRALRGAGGLGLRSRRSRGPDHRRRAGDDRLGLAGERTPPDIATVRLYTEQEELTARSLVAGRVEAIFGDGLGSHAWLEGPDGGGFEFAGAGYRLDEGIGIAVRKEDEDLLRRLNRALGTFSPTAPMRRSMPLLPVRLLGAGVARRDRCSPRCRSERCRVGLGRGDYNRDGLASAAVRPNPPVAGTAVIAP